MLLHSHASDLCLIDPNVKGGSELFLSIKCTNKPSMYLINTSQITSNKSTRHQNSLIMSK
uniref:Uncharacterized protein n=1 Tax=Anguilla anguilla TaxID=7936 RepID=A0A0E9QQ83_ANGAN